MKSDEELYDLIERYLAGKLSEEEAEQVHERLRTDKQFVEEVRAHRLADKIVLEGELLHVRDKLRHLMKQNRSRTSVMSVPFWKRMPVRIAATLALLLGLGTVVYTLILKSRPTNEELVAKYFEPAVYADVRTADSSKNTTFDSAMQYYKTKNYSRASVHFRKFILKDSTDIDALFFYGNTLLALRELEKAQFYLEKVAESGKTIYRQEALWYLALVYLAEGNKNRCRKLLEIIISEGEGPYQEIAEKLLQEMN